MNVFIQKQYYRKWELQALGQGQSRDSREAFLFCFPFEGIEEKTHIQSSLSPHGTGDLHHFNLISNDAEVQGNNSDLPTLHRKITGASCSLFLSSSIPS